MAQNEETMSVKVKTTGDERYEITIPTTATVLDLKKVIEKQSKDNVEPSLQRLIYKGRVLKDEKSLQTDYGMQDGHTIILVKSRKKKSGL